ncbi:MAG: hypothetical protein ACJAUH_000996 [Saprospiraceae bacterium]|jgi:hypothetical protein
MILLLYKFGEILAQFIYFSYLFLYYIKINNGCLFKIYPNFEASLLTFLNHQTNDLLL